MNNFNKDRFRKEVEEYSNWIFFELERPLSKNLLPEKSDPHKKVDQEKLETLQDLLDSSENQIRLHQLKEKLCPALSSIKDDLHEINKVIIKILVPIGLTSIIPLNPLLFAGISIVILKAGISAFCREF